MSTSTPQIAREAAPPSRAPEASRRPRRRITGSALLYLSPGTWGFAIFIVVPLLVSLVISVFVTGGCSGAGVVWACRTIAICSPVIWPTFWIICATP